MTDGNSEIRVDQEQISFFHREGYLALSRITTDEEISRIRQIYDELFARRAGREEGNQFDLAGTDEDGSQESLPQILSPSKYAPELADTLYHRNALAITRQLLGEGATFKGDHAIFKPAQYGAATPWHQDEAYWDPALEYCDVSIWMPLQSATPENGCMYFIPGSHKHEVMPHHPINNDPRIHGLEVDEVDDARAVACPLPAGGATIHFSRTLHYTPPNRSTIPRRAYILAVGVPAKPRATPRRFPWQEKQTTAREERARRSNRQQ